MGRDGGTNGAGVAARTAWERDAPRDLDEADSWYLEDEPGYAHPRDPYHRFDVLRTSRHLRVMLGETVIAESRAPAALFETGLPLRYRLPPDAVRAGVLAKSETVSQCPYKGGSQNWARGG